MGAWGVAAGFIGSIVGSGFASGREIYQFFSPSGTGGLWGLGLATALFVLLGATVLWAIGHWDAHSYRVVLQRTLGPVAPVADYVFFGFVYLTLAVVLSGGAAFVDQELHMAAPLGLAVFAGLTLWVERSGAQRAQQISWYMVALLAGLAIAVTSAAAAVLPMPRLQPGTPRDWPVTASLYVSYNVVLALSTLPAYRSAKLSDRLVGAVLGGLLLGLLATAIGLSNILLSEQIHDAPLPMLIVAAKVSPVLRQLYMLAVAAATLVASISYLSALAGRMASVIGRPVVRSALLILGACIVASAGLVRLVAVVYPLMGCIAIPFWLFFLVCVARERLHLTHKQG